MVAYKSGVQKVEVTNQPVKQAVSTVDSITLATVKQKAQAVAITSTAIAVGTPFVQAVQDVGTGQDFTKIVCFFEFSQPVTIDFLCGASATNLTNRTNESVTLGASTKLVKEFVLTGRYYQFRITNTGSATTNVQVAQGVLKSI